MSSFLRIFKGTVSRDGSFLNESVLFVIKADGFQRFLKVLSNGAGGGWRVVSIDPF
jgi:hypothetical protein